MTWRLVFGVITLQRWSLLNTTMMVGLMSRPTLPEWLAGGAVTLMAAAVGMTAQGPLATRALVHLPLGPRQMHRVVWMLSALLPLAILTAGRCVGGVWHAVWSDGGWAFHASAPRILFEVVYFSLIGAWAVRTPDRYQPDYREDPRLFRTLSGVAAFLVVPFVAIPRLPRGLDEMSILLWMCAAVLLAVGLVPLIWPPSVYQRPHLPAIASDSLLPPAQAGAPTTPRQSSRIEGMWVPIRGVAAQALVWTVVMLIFLAVVQRLSGVITITWPFDSSMTDLRFLITIGVPMMFLLGLCPSLAPWIAMLKRLPLSSRRTALFLSLAPTTLPIVFWTALLIIHLLAAAQTPDALRLNQLALFTGLVALVDALGTKSGSGTARLAIGFPVLGLFTYGMDENRALVAAVLEHWTLPLVGLLCLGLAWLVNFHTLTRSAGSARAFQIGRPTQTMGAR